MRDISTVLFEGNQVGLAIRDPENDAEIESCGYPQIRMGATIS